MTIRAERIRAVTFSEIEDHTISRLVMSARRGRNPSLAIVRLNMYRKMEFIPSTVKKGTHLLCPLISTIQ
jgi:hypothetical protein